MTRGWSVSAILLAALLLIPACAAPRTITLPRPDVRPVVHIDQIHGYQGAVVAIAAVLERQLGVPSFPVVFDFYEGSPAFEQALVDLGLDQPTARQASQVMRGIGFEGRVLLNTHILEANDWNDRVRLLTHELSHSLQYALSGGARGSSEQWLREGFAEWAALMVLDRLHARPFAELREQQRAAFRGSDRSRAPRFDAMMDFPQWITVVNARGIAPYSQAFLAVDALVERHGREPVIEYFRLAASLDAPRAFRAAFGEERAAFEAFADTRLGIRRKPAGASGE